MNAVPPPDPLAIARDLIRCRSVTPEEGGALSYLESVLEPAGFVCQRLPFSDKDTPDVDNLFARIGTAPSSHKGRFPRQLC